jgi:hypothetical protein
VTATSADPSGPAVAAVDGGAGTKWNATAANASLTVDLGAPYQLSQVTVQSGSGATTPYTLAVSSDGTTWRPLGSVPAGANATSSVDGAGTIGRWIRYTATGNAKANVAELSATGVPTQTSTTGDVGGTVPPTLALSLGAPASFGAFAPGHAGDYDASTTAAVTSTAGDATLSVADTGTSAPGHLVNGAFALPSPMQAAADGNLADVSGVPLALRAWSVPVSNDAFTVRLRQHIGSNDALRTGAYAKALVFTLATTQP